jgi:choline dehydrogenase-like flavoprotein
VIHDTYELDPALGLAGGGGFDFRFDWYPISFASYGLPPGSPRWGPEFKKMLRQYYTRTLLVLAHTSSLPVESNSFSLDPTVKDDWGLPALRLTFAEHENDLRLYRHFMDLSMNLLDAAGAVKRWGYNTADSMDWFPQNHLLGTCRMGDDPKSSVIDKWHRTHDVPNLFLVDGSSFVTGGRGQPTMTIMALAFRAGEHIAELARKGQI